MAAAARERRREQLRQRGEAAAAPATTGLPATAAASGPGAAPVPPPLPIAAPLGQAPALPQGPGGGANAGDVSALRQACIEENMELVQFLVETGADVNQGDPQGWTPLHLAQSWLDPEGIQDPQNPRRGAVAAAKGYLEVMRLLLQAGYDPDPPRHGILQKEVPEPEGPPTPPSGGKHRRSSVSRRTSRSRLRPKEPPGPPPPPLGGDEDDDDDDDDDNDEGSGGGAVRDPHPTPKTTEIPLPQPHPPHPSLFAPLTSPHPGGLCRSSSLGALPLPHNLQAPPTLRRCGSAPCTTPQHPQPPPAPQRYPTSDPRSRPHRLPGTTPPREEELQGRAQELLSRSRGTQDPSPLLELLPHPLCTLPVTKGPLEQLNRWKPPRGSQGSESDGSDEAPPSPPRPPPPTFYYQQLYEGLWAENERLREQLQESELQLTQCRLELERVTQRQERIQERPQLLELERFERRALELKAAELEEELKALSDLRADNQRLKDENAALIRVISRISK